MTAFKSRNTWLVAVFAGKMAKVGSDSVREGSDSMTNATAILVINQYSGGEKALE